VDSQQKNHACRCGDNNARKKKALAATVDLKHSSWTSSKKNRACRCGDSNARKRKLGSNSGFKTQFVDSQQKKSCLQMR
jgi:hypothetical protein